MGFISNKHTTRNNHDDHVIGDDNDNDNDAGTTTIPVTLRQSRQATSRRGLLFSFLFILFVAGIVVAITMLVLFGKDKNTNGTTTSSNNNNNNNTTINGGSDTSSSSTTIMNGPTTSPTMNGYRKCNGHENLCSVPFNEVYFATVHNAASTRQDGVFIIPNHEYNLESALETGYRGINIDIGKCASTGLRLIHGTCLLANRDPIEVFTNMMFFLSKNPNEVLLVPIQIDNDAEGGIVSLEGIYTDIIQVVTGLEEALYVHTTLDESISSSSWPTLGQLIDAGTRIVLMHYNAAERCTPTSVTTADGITNSSTSTSQTKACPYGLQEWFTYASETQFEIETIDAFTNNISYSCELTRGYNNPRYESDFIGINLFTSIPSVENCFVLNSKQFINNQIDSCTNLYNANDNNNNNDTYNNGTNIERPNVILVDCWDIGDVLQVVYEYNELLDPEDYVVNSSTTTTLAPTGSETNPRQTALLQLSFLNASSEITNVSTFETVCSTYFSEALLQQGGISNNTTTSSNRSVANVQCTLVSQSIGVVAEENRRVQRRKTLTITTTKNIHRNIQQQASDVITLDIVVEVSGQLKRLPVTEESSSSSSGSLDDGNDDIVTSDGLKSIVDSTGDEFINQLVLASESTSTTSSNSGSGSGGGSSSSSGSGDDSELFQSVESVIATAVDDANEVTTTTTPSPPPTLFPSMFETNAVTVQPTIEPTIRPTAAPLATISPTPMPVVLATTTRAPSDFVTFQPTISPTQRTRTTIPTTTAPATTAPATTAPATTAPATTAPATTTPPTLLGTTSSSTSTSSCSIDSQPIIPLDADTVTSVRLFTDEISETITVELVYSGIAWIGISFVETTSSRTTSMIPAIAIIGIPLTYSVAKYLMLSKSISGIDSTDIEQTLTQTSIEQNGTHTILKFTKLLNETDDVINIPVDGIISMNYAVGCTNDFNDRGHCLRGTVRYDILSSCNNSPSSTTTDDYIDDNNIDTTLDPTETFVPSSTSSTSSSWSGTVDDSAT